jgi:hypothetical protein
MKQTGAAAARPQEPSMEEILASIRRIIADDGEPEPPEPPRPVRAAPPAPPPTPQPDEKGQAFDLAAPSRSLQPPMPKLDGADLPVLDEAAKALDVEPAHKPEPTPPRQPEEPPRAPLSPEALLSGEANAHVSRAFNRLATTVLTNNARTLEDLVKDLLRPMLKAWLDDNLPPLVERLVRAEIERVARGGG